MKTNLLLLMLMLTMAASAFAQKHWPDAKKCAVCLTYDDALPSHLQFALPQLNRLGLKGTFYITGSSATLDARLDDWRKAAAEGHELGNHTILHPCNGQSKNRDWVTPEQDLDHYTMTRFLSEVNVMNTLLKAIDGKQQRTFAYTCGDRLIEDNDVAGLLPPLVRGARTTDMACLGPDAIDVFQLPAFSCDNKTADEMIAWIEKARETGSLVVLLFHGVGGDYLTTDAAEHEKLLEYLARHTDDIWVAPAIDLVNHLREN